MKLEHFVLVQLNFWIRKVGSQVSDNVIISRISLKLEVNSGVG